MALRAFLILLLMHGGPALAAKKKSNLECSLLLGTQLEIVRSTLRELGESPYQASRRIGLPRHYTGNQTFNYQDVKNGSLDSDLGHRGWSRHELLDILEPEELVLITDYGISLWEPDDLRDWFLYGYAPYLNIDEKALRLIYDLVQSQATCPPGIPYWLCEELRRSAELWSRFSTTLRPKSKRQRSLREERDYQRVQVERKRHLQMAMKRRDRLNFAWLASKEWQFPPLMLPEAALPTLRTFARLNLIEHTWTKTHEGKIVSLEEDMDQESRIGLARLPELAGLVSFTLRYPFNIPYLYKLANYEEDFPVVLIPRVDLFGFAIEYSGSAFIENDSEVFIDQILFVHGSADQSLSLEQAFELASNLKKHITGLLHEFLSLAGPVPKNSPKLKVGLAVHEKDLFQISLPELSLAERYLFIHFLRIKNFGKASDELSNP